MASVCVCKSGRIPLQSSPFHAGHQEPLSAGQAGPTQE